MKKTKLFFLSLVCALALPTLVACDDDDDWSYFVDMATVVKDNDRWLLDGDNVGLMLPDNEGLLTATDSKKEDQRVIVKFNFKEGAERNTASAQSIEMYGLARVLTKPVFIMPNEASGATPDEIEEKQDSIGNDRIRLMNGFVSKKHVNLYFCLYTRYNDVPHFINLVADQGAKPDADGVLTVELRHNLSGNMESVLAGGWVAFPLSSIPGYDEGLTKKLKIITHDIDEGKTVEDELDLNVNNNEKPNISDPTSFSNTKIS